MTTTIIILAVVAVLALVVFVALARSFGRTIDELEEWESGE